MAKQARQWTVRGRVQGVGFRAFVQMQATALGLNGWTQNRDDGTVLVYAVGDGDSLNALAGKLHQGPSGADVRGVEEREAAVQHLSSFRVRY